MGTPCVCDGRMERERDRHWDKSTLLQIFQVSNKEGPCEIGGNRSIKKGGLEKHSPG